MDIFHPIPPSSPQNVPQIYSNSKEQGNFLSNEDFENLIKSLQLLRISQLRYIVQKYAIPASGNKTKLLNLTMSIFHSLRYDKILIDIYQDINLLISQQDEPFNNPLLSVGHLELVQIEPSFTPPETHTFQLNYLSPIFGPINVPIGMSSGSFLFDASSNFHCAIAFLFKNSQPQSFSLQCELNGISYSLSDNDSFPQPLDVSNVLSSKNIFNIKAISTTVPMHIIICQYHYSGLSDLVSSICGYSVDSSQPLFVNSPKCSHSDSFPLIPFLSKSLATGKWICPICSNPIQLSDLQLQDYSFNLESGSDFLQNNKNLFLSSDIFKNADNFDWDIF